MRRDGWVRCGWCRRRLEEDKRRPDAVASHILTVEEIPSHSHTGSGGTNWNVEVSKGANTGNFIGSSGIAWIENTSVHVGGSQPHNNMPYSVCVPLWRRTA